MQVNHLADKLTNLLVDPSHRSWGIWWSWWSCSWIFGSMECTHDLCSMFSRDHVKCSFLRTGSWVYLERVYLYDRRVYFWQEMRKRQMNQTRVVSRLDEEYDKFECGGLKWPRPDLHWLVFAPQPLVYCVLVPDKPIRRSSQYQFNIEKCA